MVNHYFFDNIKRFFSLNKTLVIFITTIFLLGGVTGVFCVLKSSNYFTIYSLKDFLLKEFLLNKISLFSFFFIKIIILSLLLFIIYLLSNTKIFPILFSIFLLYISFLMGVNSAIIFIIFPSMKGIIIFIPFFLYNLIFFFLICVFGFKMCGCNSQMSRFGNCYINGIQFKVISFFFFILSINLLLNVILYALIFNFLLI